MLCVCVWDANWQWTGQSLPQVVVLLGTHMADLVQARCFIHVSQLLVAPLGEPMGSHWASALVEQFQRQRLPVGGGSSAAEL